MSEPAREQRMTFEQAAELDPDTEGGELVEGRLDAVTRNTWRHGEVAARVCIALGAYMAEHPGWSLATGDPGAKLGGLPARGGPRDRALEYLDAGSKMVWLVDPHAERVVVCAPPNSVSVLGRDDELDGGAALPGFRCRVASLFE